ncbi:hypothetical protein Poli38472_007821 [Pythium oligandrum]|uniref:Nucleolar complex protein 2 homolog n=1 Tax=Pythium oligandrum TaxID=41045 RepID=A0A8K1CRY6_PYTOL|nr:hypothetical protein Poli38472_007821 [Pythium oligandrum]|eukprot:TMW68149.1 hypothetical protein Poli38472_007821 [Pythium oligandrum]
MGSQKKKAIKFIAKGHLAKKIQQRNQKKKVKAQREKRKNKYENEDGKPKKKELAVPSGNTGKKEESDMMNDMDVDEFLNGEFLDSEPESDVEKNDPAATADSDDEEDGDIKMEADDSSSEEEDEDALDPRYMTSFPSFGGDDDDDDDDEDKDDADADAEADMNDDESAAPVGRTTLTMEILIKAEKECFDKTSMNSARRMVKIFSDACRSSDAADMSKQGEIMYDIESSAVYNRLMLNVFRKMHLVFAKLVGSTTPAEGDNDNEQQKVKVDERKWKKHSLMIKRFFSCVSYVLGQTTGQDIQTFVLRELAHYIPYLLPCQKTAGRLLRTLLKLWAKSLNNNVCMLAFVRIRDLALQMPFPFLELALKGIYITYTRNTKFTNEATLPHHVLLGNCVVELFGLDIASSYQHAFVYIRELAITIRKTITSPSPDTFKAVLNWQFFNQLRVWTAVVCAYPEENQLHALVYPLCQLLFAVVRLASTIRYAPMRFQCVKLLQQIAFATNSFVPTSPVLLEILNMPPFSTSYRGAKTKHSGGSGDSTRSDLDLDLAVKLSKSQLDNRRVHDQIVFRLFELLQRECDVYKFHIGFPEFTVPLLLALNKFSSNCRIPKWNSLARGLTDSLKKRADWIRAKRSGLDIAPKDLAKMNEFLKSERESAIKKVFATDAEELKKKLETQQEANKNKTVEYNSDSDADSDDEKTKVEETKNSKKKSKKKGKKTQKEDSSAGVDDATFAKVKKMSLSEFKKSVAAVDADDVVEDFAFSDDE